MSARPCLALAVMLVGLGSPALARPVYEDRVDDYIVVAGDTISDITEDILGDETFWEDNWKLNPQVRDPDMLRIGQRLRIIMSRKVIAEAAQVIAAVNRTEKMITQPRWQPAAAGDTLGSGQGLRTREKSTAELRFNAESSLRLGEFSQVFLAKKETTLRGVDRGSIEVKRGEVDLVFAPIAKPKTRIEIVAGPSTTTPTIIAGKPTELRTGSTKDGGARVMMFAGQSDVSAAGAAVAVKQGMGTRVPDAGPPMTPEKLLAAPVIEAVQQSWNYSNGILRWSAVPTAAAYVVSVCADELCKQIRQRKRVDAPTPSTPSASASTSSTSQAVLVQVDPLPAGTSYWRVHAVSPNDLDGYTSPNARIEVTDPRPDLDPPMLALIPASGFVEGSDGAIRLGPNATLQFVVHDEQSGVESVEVQTAGGEWQPWADAVVEVAKLRDAPLHLRARDRLGQSSPVLEVEAVAEGAADL